MNDKGTDARVDDTKGAQAVDDTEARRTQRKGKDREEQARLLAELAKRRCRSCGQIGTCEITSSPKPEADEPRVRHVKCRACGFPDKVVIEERH